MFKRYFVIFIMSIVIVLAGCGGKPGPASPVRIAVPFSVSSIPVLALDGTEIAGRKIAVSIFQDHSLTLAEFLRGDVDVLMTGFNQGEAAFAANNDVRQLATVVWGVSSIVVRDPRIKTLADLAGKRLTVPFAKSPLDLQTRAILAAQGLAGKVTIEYGPPAQAVALLLAGQTDAVAVPEPFPAQLEAAGQARRLARYQDLWAAATGGEARSPQVTLFVMKAFADANKELTAALVRATDDATKSVMADPDQAAQKHAAAFKLDAAIVRQGLANTLFAVPTRPEDVRLSADYLKRLGLEPIAPVFYYEY